MALGGGADIAICVIVVNDRIGAVFIHVQHVDGVVEPRACGHFRLETVAVITGGRVIDAGKIEEDHAQETKGYQDDGDNDNYKACIFFVVHDFFLERRQGIVFLIHLATNEHECARIGTDKRRDDPPGRLYNLLFAFIGVH